MLKATYLRYLLFFMFISCSPAEKVDMILFNGEFITLDDNIPNPEALVINKGRILNVGSMKDLKERYQASMFFDLGGKQVLPGLMDAHSHFKGYALQLERVDLVGSKSLEEALSRIKEKAIELQPGKWILGRGWDQNLWNGNYPDRASLDELFPNHPVCLKRVDGHAAWVNTKALSLAGITRDTKISGGEILKRMDGSLQGILIDNAVDQMELVIPEPSKSQIEAALLRAQDSCFSVGLTSVSDCGLDRHELEIIKALEEQGKLKLSVYGMINPKEENFSWIREKGPIQTEFLKVKAVKIYMDGALGSRGARLKKDYSDDPGNCGLFLIGEDSLMALLTEASKLNLQVCTHAIGDSAIKKILVLYLETEKTEDHRWRVEHAQVLSMGDMVLFKKGDIIPSVQPTHATSDMYWAGNRLGEQRLKGAYAFKSLLNAAGVLPLGSDFPVESINPFFGLYAAISRKDKEGYPENGFQPEEKLTRLEALKGFTSWASYAQFEEKEKGSLSPGKWADLIVLDHDYFNCPEQEIVKIKPLKTMVHGKWVYQNN